MKLLKEFVQAALVVVALLLPFAATRPQPASAGGAACTPSLIATGVGIGFFLTVTSEGVCTTNPERPSLPDHFCTINAPIDAHGIPTGAPLVSVAGDQRTYKYDLRCIADGKNVPVIHVIGVYDVAAKTAHADLTPSSGSRFSADWKCPDDPWSSTPSCSRGMLSIYGGNSGGFDLSQQTAPFSMLYVNKAGHARLAQALQDALKQPASPQQVLSQPLPPLADLTVLSIQVSDKTGTSGCGSGDGNTVSVVVHNSGNAAPKPADLLLRYYGGERTLPGAVTAGPAQDQQLTFEHVPMTPGGSSLGALVNPGLVNGTGGVAESDNTNNFLSVTVTCATQPANLQVASLQILNAAGAEITDSSGKLSCLAGPNTIRARVSNTGDTDPGVVDLQLLVDNTPAGTASMGGVGPHSDKLSSLGTVDLAAYSHTVQVIIDPKGKAIQSDLLVVTCTEVPQ
jgi:hypothetical protein